MTEHREFFRKKTKSTGYLLQASGEVQFQVRDISVEGFQAHFDKLPPFGTDQEVRVRLPTMNLQGSAKVVRIEPEGDKGFLVGFIFTEHSEWNPASVFMSSSNE